MDTKIIRLPKVSCWFGQLSNNMPCMHNTPIGAMRVKRILWLTGMYLKEWVYRFLALMGPIMAIKIASSQLYADILKIEIVKEDSSIKNKVVNVNRREFSIFGAQ
jgi:hypothetical protein